MTSTASNQELAEAQAGLETIWRLVLRITEPLDLDDNFFDLGGDSMAAMEMLAEVREFFGVDLDASWLLDDATLASVALAIHRHWEAPPAASLVQVRPGGDAVPLFWVHDWYGHALVGRSFWQGFPADQPIYEIQAQGVDGKMAALANVTDIAASYVRLMREVQPEGPYQVGGYSFGGTLAFEIARLLRRQGAATHLLAMVDTFCLDRPSALARARRHLRTVQEVGPRAGASYVFRAGRGVAVRTLWRHSSRNRLLNGGAGTRPAFAPRREQAFLVALETYRPRRFDGRAVFFAAEGSAQPDAAAGWGRYLEGGVEVVSIPGNHLTVFSAAHRQVIAEELRARLAGARPRPSTASAG